MKRMFLFVACAFLIASGMAQTVNSSNNSTPLKVACIGNSITYGSGIPDRSRDSYPSQLARMQGEKWEVRNFGETGRSMLRQRCVNSGRSE